MASVVDAFNEALSEDLSFVKIALYSIPVYFCAKFFLVGKMGMFYFYGVLTAILLLGLLTQGINNVRMNKSEILTLKPLCLLNAVIRTFIAVAPQLAIFGTIGYLLVKHIHIPIELPHVPLIFAIIVWSIMFSIILTSYISFSKYLKIEQAFNYKVIGESCIDVLVSFLFFIPQLLIANLVLVGPVAYLFFFFHLPFTHWGFVMYCSLAFIVNISILANYLAQASYEHIKGSNEEYDDHSQINLIDESAERMRG